MPKRPLPFLRPAGTGPIDLPDNEHPQTAPVNISLGGSLEAALAQAEDDSVVFDRAMKKFVEVAPAPVVATQIASSADLARGVTGDDQSGLMEVTVNGEEFFVGVPPLAAAKATRKDVLARLDSLKIPEPYVPTAAEVERERRITDLRTASLQLATHVTDVLGAINSLELGAVRDALEDLANFTQKAAFAIDSIPDAKLDLTEEAPAEDPAPRKKRRTKVEIQAEKDEAAAQARYDAALEAGLSDAEAREDGWPSVNPADETPTPIGPDGSAEMSDTEVDAEYGPTVAAAGDGF